MEATQRLQINALIRQAARDPGHHGLFMLLRELERLSPSGLRWGDSTDPAQDPVRIGENLSLAFEGREIAAVRQGRQGQPPRIMQNVMTLVGPAGPMPLHFAEAVREREFNQGDPVLARFLDMLLHRVLTFYYRAWATTRIVVSADQKTESDWVLNVLLALSGVRTDASESFPRAIDPRSVAVRARELARPTRGRDELEGQLGYYFGVPVAINEYVPCATDISSDGRFILERQEADSTMQLGSGVPIGKTTFSLSNRFLVAIGPLSSGDYQRFLPGEGGRSRLEEWIRLYVGNREDWDLQLLMKGEDARPLQLGRRGQLRRDSWLGEKHHKDRMHGYHRRFEPLAWNERKVV